MARVVAFGEGMIELSRGRAGEARIGFGGDTLNSAVYLSRLGVDSHFMSAVGSDPWSDDLLASWRSEGVGCDLVVRHPTRLPGVYGINVRSDGERSFSYWREQSAAREFFYCPDADRAVAAASGAELFLISGIGLAILDETGRARLHSLACSVRERGGRVAFDPNYRARLWPSLSAYREAVLAIAPLVDIALPSFDDEAAVWGDPSADECFARWRALGPAEVVVKDGARGAVTAEGLAPAVSVSDVVDTTGAGDSFNAGYVARRLAGDSVYAAAQFAATLAACVVRFSGAIVPRSALAGVVGGVAT